MTPLCSAPFYVFSVKPDGFRPCCSRRATPQSMNNVDEWWNSEYLKNFRKQMLSGDVPDDCKKCMASGDTGDHTYSPTMNVVKQVGYNPETGEVAAQPGQIFYFLGNKCNLACRTCDNSYSDMFEKIFPELIIPVRQDYEPYKQHRSDLEHIIKSNPKQVILYGGEPFMTRDIYDIVEQVITRTTATVSFLSNGSVDIEKHRVFPILRDNACRITITFSIDGSPEVNEKIRVKVKNDLIAKNVALCQRLGIYCESHFTMSNMNAHDLPDYIEFLYSEFGKQFRFNIASLEYPVHFVPQLRDDIDDVRLAYLKYYWNKMMKGEMTADVNKSVLSAIHKMTHPRDLKVMQRFEEVSTYMDDQVGS